MTPRDIINALDALDEDLVLDARSVRKRKKKGHSIRKLLLLTAAAAVIGTLALSAVAASGSADWFRDFFSGRSGGGLTLGQEAYIRDNTVRIGQTQTRDGYTITLESAITDGRKVFARFQLTGPEGTKLDADWYGDWDSRIVNEEGEDLITGSEGFYAGYSTWQFTPVEGAENKITLLYETEAYYRGQRAISEQAWTFYINGLWHGHKDEELGMRREKIAEGTWSFTLRFPEGCDRELELIKDPVTVRCVLGGSPGVPGITPFDQVRITSFDLRALTAEITFRHEEKESVNAHFGDVYLVMKDGTKLLMQYEYNVPNARTFCFEAPIDLDQVDHILFPDGTIIPVG